MRFFFPPFQSRQMIWNAVYVLPVPVAITSRIEKENYFALQSHEADDNVNVGNS